MLQGWHAFATLVEGFESGAFGSEASVEVFLVALEGELAEEARARATAGKSSDGLRRFVGDGRRGRSASYATEDRRDVDALAEEGLGAFLARS